MTSEWRKATLGDFVRLQRGHDLTAEDRVNGQYPVMGSAGQNGTHATWKARGPGVVIGRSGSSIGRVHYTESDYWPHNTCLYVTDFLGNHPKFAFYCLSLLDLRAYNSGSAQPSLNRNYIYGKPVLIPNINEQISIAELLGAMDERIESLRQTNAALEAIAQALFKSWFVDFDPVRAKTEGREPEGIDAATAALFPGEFEDSELGPIPQGWRVSTVGECASVIDCLHAKKPELLSTGRPYLQLNCIRDDGLLDTKAAARISDADYEKWTSRIEASPGDCVITNVGRVGAVAQVPAGFTAAIGRNMTGIRPKGGFQPTFLIELLMSDCMRREIEHKTDAGTILNALNVKSIPKLRFVCASENVLRRFEDLGRPLRSAMEANLERANALAELRDTLLPRLISGKVRLPQVKGLEHELAEASA